MADGQRSELWGGLLDGRYRIGRTLGTGATGVVLAARDEQGRRLAIKLLHSSLAGDTELAQRLREEARVSGQVRHPGLVECLGQGVLPDGSPYVVFERVEGESLLSLLRRSGQLELGEAVLVGQRVARILSAVHGAGYVHRDVKPEHIVLSSQDELLSVRLLDFGVCQAPHETTRNRSFAVYGTPGYASPEQAAADSVDGRSDLFALGATLYEALTGRPAFVGPNPAAILTRTLSEPPVSLGTLRPDCPRGLEALVMRLLARERAARPANALLVARELARCSDVALEGCAARLHYKLRRARAQGLRTMAQQQRPTRRIKAAC